MVQFLVTSQIQDAISEYNAKQGLSTDDAGYITQDLPSVEHLQLAHVAVTLKLPLHQLLGTTQLYLPPIEKPKPVSSKSTNTHNRTPSTKHAWQSSDGSSKNKSTTK
jgi:hypothetical protein